MIEKKIEFRKKRELGDIISNSFDFLKQEYKPISKLVFRYVLPFLVVYGILQVYVQINILGEIDLTAPDTITGNIGPIYSNILLFSLFGVFVHALLIGLLYSYIKTYIEKGRGNIDITEIKNSLFQNSQLAISTSILLYIVVLLGLFLFIVPGIYFANTFSLAVMIAIFEKKGIANAFSRSWILVKTQWWQTFFLALMGIVITWFAGFILSLPSIILRIDTNSIGEISSASSEQSQLYWIMVGISSIISSLCWIIPYTFLAFQYFNLDERTKPTSPLDDSSLFK